MARGRSLLLQALRPVLPLLFCAFAAATRAEDVPALSPAAVAKAAAAPEVRQARAAMGDSKRDNHVLALLSKAAQQGNAVAQAYLGWLYYMGHGLAQNDRIAASWYRRAAMQGFADAELRLGLMYRNGRDLGGLGRSLQSDRSQARYWLKRAADHGSAPALDLLGDAYLKPGAGLGSDPDATVTLAAADGDIDIESAVAAYEGAAALGSGHALAQLCTIYSAYRDDPDARADWCALAAQYGDAGGLAGKPFTLGIEILNSDRIPLAER